MSDSVYDTSLVAYSNGDLAGRRRGNVLDRRLSRIEEFLNGKRVAWYNNKLLAEYEQHIKESRNDVIEAFLIALENQGRRSQRSALSRQNFATATRARWPAHDQHLLAAALEGDGTTIFVTEEALAACGTAILRSFGISVDRIA